MKELFIFSKGGHDYDAKNLGLRPKDAVLRPRDAEKTILRPRDAGKYTSAS